MIRIGIVTAAVGLGALTISSGMARGLARPNAALALSFAPYDGIAAARLADSIVRRVPAGAAPDKAARYALRALARDPTRADAARVLGFIAEVNGDRAAAERLVTGAASLSRRDLPSQLWLIENRVAAEDVPGALVHYDIALRTSPSAWGTLAPVLVEAWSDAELAPQIRRMLLANPPYLPHLMSLGADNRDAAPEVARTIVALRQTGITVHSQHSAAVLAALAAAGDWAGARRLYAGVAGAPPTASSDLVDDLTTANRYLPFDWSVAAPSEVVSLDDDAIGLAFALSDGRVVAERAIPLQPGRYRFEVTTDTRTADGDGILRWTARCGTADGRLLGQATAGVRAGSTQQLSSAFEVPADGCPFVHLALAGRARDEDVRGIVTAMRLSR